MLKRVLCALVLALLLVVAGCSTPKSDFFDLFRGGYVAEVAGTLYGIDISAKIEMGAVGEAVCAPATITFYAPEEILGTVITRTEDGTITLFCGDVAAGDMGGVGAALFALFPTSGSVSKTEVTEQGRTRVALEGAELEFLSDGTPYSVKTGDLSLTVVQWQAHG